MYGESMKNKKPHWIPVVTGLMKKGEQVLLGQRPKGTLAGQWEFPGGKIELGESPKEALKRELNEELDIDAEVGELRLACTHNYGDIGILILFFDVPFWKGEPKAKHHSDLQWANISELKKIDIPEANKKNLGILLDILQTPTT